jgi:hypothetical protein
MMDVVKLEQTQIRKYISKQKRGYVITDIEFGSKAL